MDKEQKEQKEKNTVEIPSNFGSVMNDFTRDLTLTFPEYAHLWSRWMDPNNPIEDFENVYRYCLAIYPQRFFDILYQNEDIFSLSNDESVNTFFLPGVDFKHLFNAAGISENIKSAIWKYLQLVLVTIMSGIKDKTSFGDTMNLFDGVDQDVLQSKLSETISGLADFFKGFENDCEETTNKETNKETNKDTTNEEGTKDFEMPDMEKMKELFENMKETMGKESEREGQSEREQGQERQRQEGEPMNELPDFSQLEDLMKMFQNMGSTTGSQEGAPDFSKFSGLFKMFQNMGMGGMGAKGMGKKMPDMKKLFKMFENMPEGTGLPDFKNMFNFEKMAENMPNPEELSGHLKGLFDGKIGTLAKELAEELSGDLMGMFSTGMDTEGTGTTGNPDMQTTQQILGEMMKNPQKIMELLKKVGSKLDDKMKNGDISQEEMMKEATELMGKMKGMGGGKEFQDMMQNMMKGMPGLGKGAKIDSNAMTRMTTHQAHKNRMLAKLEARKKAVEEAVLSGKLTLTPSGQQNVVLHEGSAPNNLVFKMPEQGVQEKTRVKAREEVEVQVPNDDWLDDYTDTSAQSQKKSMKSGKANKKKGKK